MSKKQFTLDSWLKDKSQKVVTRCGFPVRIVCTDVKRKDYPILALVERDDQEEYQSFTKDGRFSLYNPLHDNFDLFIETADEVSEDEKIRKRLIQLFQSDNEESFGEFTNKQFVAWLEKQGEPTDKGEISDGYHTFNELYYYRMLYNAAFFNMLPKEWVHKSKKHHDGEECFGGGWFIVMANLPTGQISNHYELKDWNLFRIPEKEVADKWDGHTPQEAADRLYKYLLEKQAEQKPSEWSEEDEDLLKWSINNLTELKDRYGEGYGKVGKCIDWLKSLRPQNHWKPTDEQMGCLSDAIEHYNSLGYPAPKLKELYEQLKKL